MGLGCRHSGMVLGFCVLGLGLGITVVSLWREQQRKKGESDV